MDFILPYITFWIFILSLLLMLLCFKKEMKKTEGFPFSFLIPIILFDQITGKIPKDVPFTSYLFETIMRKCKEFDEEGFLMTYITRPILFIFSAEAMKFFSNEKAAIDKPPEYDMVEDVIGAGILTSNGERWRSHRKMINPSFHMGMLKDKVPFFNEHATRLIKDMEEMVGKSSVDVLEALKCNYFNSLSESVFGLKQTEENKVQNLKCFHSVDSAAAMVVQRMLYPWLRPNCLLPFSAFGRRYKRCMGQYKSFVTNVINDMNELVESNQNVPTTLPITKDTHRFSAHLQKSFTYILLRHHYNDPLFTFQDLHDEVSTILVTGYDTVTYTTLWCLFMIALHPDVQEKAFKEVEGTTDGYVSYEDVCNLTYLEAIIMESLRLYPTLPLFARNITEDVQFGKYKVHKGTTIVFLPYLSHRNPDIFHNPEMFEPERFLNQETRKTWSYVPFSEGARSCIGKKYAFIEMKIFLAHILRNFKLSSLEKREDIGLCWDIILTPARAIHMKITSRHANEN